MSFLSSSGDSCWAKSLKRIPEKEIVFKEASFSYPKIGKKLIQKGILLLKEENILILFSIGIKPRTKFIEKPTFNFVYQ